MSGRGRRTEGQGLVEFALILPVFLLGLMMVFDFGRAIYGYNTITNAARAGARLWIVDQNPTAVEERAMSHTVGMNPDDITVELDDDCPDPALIGCTGEVTVNYTYQALTPIIGSIVGTIDLHSTTRMRLERVFDSS